MPTRKQLSERWESEMEFPETRATDDPLYREPKPPTMENNEISRREDISEEIMQWIKENPDADYVSIPGKYIGWEPTYWRGVMTMYRYFLNHELADMESYKLTIDMQEDLMTTLTQERDMALESSRFQLKVNLGMQKDWIALRRERDELIELLTDIKNKINERSYMEAIRLINSKLELL